MAKHPLWNDDYWLFLLQLYQKKPTGVKSTYQKDMVELSLYLHIPPRYLHQQMFRLRMMTPHMQRLWQRYGKNPQLLAKDIEALRAQNGCGNAPVFYDGVRVSESFEKDWRPLDSEPQLTPVKLILILDLYFQLTPITMVAETPEIAELGKLTGTTPQLIEQVMHIYQYLDPYLEKGDMSNHPLTPACKEIWQRYGNEDPNTLYELANNLKVYFR